MWSKRDYEVELNNALERVNEYLATHTVRVKKSGSIDEEILHSYGTNEGQVHLLRSDLDVLVSAAQRYGDLL